MVVTAIQRGRERGGKRAEEKHVVRDPGARAGWGNRRLALPRAGLHTHKVKHVCVCLCAGVCGDPRNVLPAPSIPLRDRLHWDLREMESVEIRLHSRNLESDLR